MALLIFLDADQVTPRMASPSTATMASVIDRLHYAMLATRARSHLVRGEDAEVASWRTARHARRAPMF